MNVECKTCGTPKRDGERGWTEYFGAKRDAHWFVCAPCDAEDLRRDLQRVSTHICLLGLKRGLPIEGTTIPAGMELLAGCSVPAEHVDACVDASARGEPWPEAK